ncbi:MAG: SpoIID/LytB domain-containing protein, partial [Eubacteriales bacterium]
AVVLFPYLGFSSYAAEPQQSSEYFTGDENVRVGLMYGTGVTVGFEVRAAYGMDLVSVNGDGSVTSVGQLFNAVSTGETLVSVTSDANLSKNSMTYSLSSSSPTVGGYHIQIMSSSSSVDGDLAWAKSIAQQYGYNVFKAYINGQYVIRVGQFFTYDSASAATTSFASVFNSMSIAAPTDTAVSVIDPNTDNILFEYDCGGVSQLGIRAIQTPGADTAYLITPAKNKYDGIFEFSRYIYGSTDGVQLVDILPIEDYVLGVLPWEISNAWPIEVQKAFAVTVRTYAAAMMGRHNQSYGFDLCSTTHCQAYMGVGRVNELVRRAVSETAGMVLTYDGEPAITYYSAVTGGVTVSATEAWGGTGSYPYLKAVATPWENYAAHANGSWTAEVSPEKLLAALVSKGYTQLSGSIASVHIDSFAQNSSYVYSITFTDTSGHTATITNCDKIRTTLSAYLKSANFVVAKAGEQVSVINYKLTDMPASANPSVPPAGDTSQTVPLINVMTVNGAESVLPGESLSVIKAVGAENISDTQTLYVRTADGTSIYSPSAQSSDTAQTTEAVTSSSATLPDITNPLGMNVITETETVTAAGSAGNFVFIGRGWGHGVGLSQYGAKNLAELGYGYEAILKAYFSGTQFNYITSIKK